MMLGFRNLFIFFFSSRRRHTRSLRDWSSDVCSSDLATAAPECSKESLMKLCRYDDDRLGIVRGELVHDVTQAQTEIRAAASYAMKGDAVIAALPQWRDRLERLADKTPGKALAQLKLLAPVARPTKLSCAPT